MRFQLVSPRWIFEEAQVACGRDLASAVVLMTTSSARLSSDYTDDITGVRPGEIQLLLHNCRIRSSKTNATYQIPSFLLEALVTEDDAEAGIRQIVVGFHSVVRIEALGADDRPLLREHVIGVALLGISIEARGPQPGALQLFLAPGEYIGYLVAGHSSPVQKWFKVAEGDGEAVTIQLRETEEGGPPP